MKCCVWAKCEIIERLKMKGKCEMSGRSKADEIILTDKICKVNYLS